MNTDKKEEKEEKIDIEAKCQEYLNGWKRERADFLNYKKEETEKIGQLIKYANEELILKILPILDNIYLAEKELPEEIKNNKWTEGFLQIKIQLLDFLQKEGIEAIEVLGKKFDPNFMDVMEEIAEKPEIESNEQETGIVVEEIQKGYTLRGKIIRPAKVKITK